MAGGMKRRRGWTRHGHYGGIYGGRVLDLPAPSSRETDTWVPIGKVGINESTVVGGEVRRRVTSVDGRDEEGRLMNGE